MRATGLLASLVAAGLAYLVIGRIVESVIFQPTRGVDLRPEQLGIDAEEVWIETEDGVRLHAFYLPSPGATRALLFLHGNAGNASHRLPNAAQLASLGVDVLLLDYRGYGLSDGTPSEEGTYADARAALAYLVDERGFPEERIVVFGRSLGGAVAVDLARGRPLAGLILESTFTSAGDVAARVFAAPLRPLLGRRFDSRSKIAGVRSPLLFFHGDRDEIIDYEIGRRLYEAAPEPKAFETLHGAGHNDTVMVGGARYFERIRRFLDDVAPVAGRS